MEKTLSLTDRVDTFPDCIIGNGKSYWRKELMDKCRMVRDSVCFNSCELSGRLRVCVSARLELGVKRKSVWRLKHKDFAFMAEELICTEVIRKRRCQLFIQNIFQFCDVFTWFIYQTNTPHWEKSVSKPQRITWGNKNVRQQLVWLLQWACRGSSHHSELFLTWIHFTLPTYDLIFYIV